MCRTCGQLWCVFLIIVIHRADLAMAVVDSGAVPTIVLCVNEADMPVRRTAVSALSEICKHTASVRPL